MDESSNPINPLSSEAPAIGPSTSPTPTPTQPVPPMAEATPLEGSAPPPTVSKKSNKKIFVIAGVIVLLLILVMGAAVAFTQMSSVQVESTPAPTVAPTPVVEDLRLDWKTYESSVYKYIVSVPPEFNFMEGNSQGGQAMAESESLSIVKTGEDATILIQGVDVVPPTATIETTLAGMKVYQVDFGSEQSTTDVYYLAIPNTEDFLEIYISKATDQNLIEQILSTFKFTE